MHAQSEEEWRASVEWIGIVAGSVIEKDGKFLLVQEKQKRVYGQWSLPGGRVDRGESFEQAAIREAREETGYDIEILTKIAIYHESAQQTVKHVFKAIVVGGERAIQANEILDAQWMTLTEIRTLHAAGKLRTDWLLEVIEKSMKEQN